MSWGAVIVGGSMLVGGYMASQASKSASSTQAEAARDAASSQVYAADKAYEATMAGIKSTEKMTAPWRKAGGRALTKLESMLAAGPGKYTESPGYQFRLSEGEKAINRFASAKSGLLSGATGKALVRYGQDYATQDYDQFLARYYQSLTPYQSLAGLGQTTAVSTAANTQAGYSNLANINMQSGAAQAAGITGSAQATASNYLTQGKIWSDTLNQGLNAYAQWMNSGGTAGKTAGGYSGVGTYGVSPGSANWH